MPGAELTPFDRGLLLGVLIGEGSFGGDGKQPQVTLRMHVRHEALFHWLVERFPRSKLYGPYHHGNRHYFQWMVRGRALVRAPAHGFYETKSRVWSPDTRGWQAGLPAPERRCLPRRRTGRRLREATLSRF